MEIKENKTIDMLTKDGVSIKTERFLVEDENTTPTPLGMPHRIGYNNSTSGREKLISDEPEDIVSSVLAIWGDEPTVEEKVETTSESNDDN